MSVGTRHNVKKRLRWLWLVLLLPIVAVTLPYLPPFQQWVAGLGADWLSRNTGYTLSLGKVRILFPFRLQVDDCCVMQNADTLLRIEQIRARASLRSLWKSRIVLPYVAVKEARLQVDSLQHPMLVNGGVQDLSVLDVAWDVNARTLQVGDVNVRDTDWKILQTVRRDSAKESGSRFPLLLAVNKVKVHDVAIDYLAPALDLQGSISELSLDSLTLDTLSAIALQAVSLREGDLCIASTVDTLRKVALTSLQFQANALFMTSDSLCGEVSHLTFCESHGIALQEGRLSFAWDGEVARLPYFVFRTPSSSLVGHLHMMDHRAPVWMVDADVDAQVSYADVERIAMLFPTIADAERYYPKEPLMLNVAIDGPIDDLRLTHCRIAMPTIFEAQMSGEIHGLPVMHDVEMQLRLDAMAHRSDYLEALLSSRQARRITLPWDVKLTGFLVYTADSVGAQVQADYDGGLVDISACYRPYGESYAVHLRVDTLDMHRIFPDEDLGRVTLQASVEGAGMEMFGAQSNIACRIHIDSVVWAHRAYTNAYLSASLYGRHLQLEAEYADTLLHMHCEGAGGYSDGALYADLQMQVYDMHLLGLGVTDRDIRSSFHSRWELEGSLSDYYRVDGYFDEISLMSPHGIVRPHPVALHSFFSADSLSLALHAGDLSLTADADCHTWPWMWSRQHRAQDAGVLQLLASPRVTLRANADNPVSNYLAMLGVALSSLDASVREQEGSLVATLSAGPLSMRGMVVDTVSLAANYVGGTLNGTFRVDDFAWQTAMMQLAASANGEFVWRDAFRSSHLQGIVGLSDVDYRLPSYNLALHTADTLLLPFMDGAFALSDVPLYAAGKQPLLVNGSVALMGTTPSLRLMVEAKQVSLLQRQRTQQSQLYGSAIVSGRIHLTGPFDALLLEGRLSLQGGSSLYYIYKDVSLASSNSLDDVVTFTNFMANPRPGSADKGANPLDGFTMRLGVEIASSVFLQVLLGANGGNMGTIQGGGLLDLQYIPAVGLRLLGKYTVVSGNLQLNIPLLHVNSMTITPGSTLQWSGNALNPILNVTAEDEIRASVTIDDTPQTVLFVAGVSLSNTMEHLGLQFTLSAPESASMQNLLSTLAPDERSKLAVALLTTGLYLGEGGTGNLMNTALLGFLQSQLDDISRDTFRSVDVSVGVDPLPDGVSGVSTRTDYSFSIAKRFWDDRIRVVVGGSVTTSNERIESETIIDNFSVEWRIKPNGNQYLRLFYDKNYESILEGEIREAGVGYVYRKIF